MRVEIDDAQIKYAEECLIKPHRFDLERVEFIKNLESVDLQAVPGSGKTTALLAKLVILEKHLPFSNGSAILVLSHTNTAVDELKLEIQKYCPKLFTYPNFIGTIQSFVDEFLAIPYYTHIYKKKVFRIDNEIYDEKVKVYYSNIPSQSSFRIWLDRRNDPIEWLSKIRFDLNWKLIPSLNKKPDDFELKNETTETYKSIVTMKNRLYKWGYLHFEDAYHLANCYVKHFPQIKNLLQKRFSFVFVDEMQDMDEHQSQLLEYLFYDDGNCRSIYQRIGDKNQAIYDSTKPKLREFWEERNPKQITGSLRLSKPIGKVVQNFALSPIEIKGLRKNEDGSDIDLLPHIILYDDENKTQVIQAFAELIRNFINQKKIPENPDNKYYAIAWNSIWQKQEDIDNKDKIRLADYYSDYSREEDKSYIDYSSLESYLTFYDKSNKTLYSIRRNILNAFLRILRIEKYRDIENDSREFSKRRLMKYLQFSICQDFYEDFKLNLFNWSFEVAKGNKQKVVEEIKLYIPTFLSKFERSINNNNLTEDCKDFLGSSCPIELKDKNKEILSREQNVFEYDDEIKIKIGTVHSVKGQTHTATLYLESAFQKDGIGENAKSYESQRLCEQFKNNLLTGDEGKRVKQSAKMIYVGFSRPTHLLCVAIHKDRFEKYLYDISQNLWEVVEIN